MPDLGTKHECEECGTKFYDLGKTDSVCPNCSWVPGAAVESKPKAAKKKPAKKAAKKAPKKAAKKAKSKGGAAKEAKDADAGSEQE